MLFFCQFQVYTLFFFSIFYYYYIFTYFIIKNKSLIPKIEQINPFTYYDGIDADKNADYAVNKTSLKRMDTFVKEIKANGFKYTSAFLGNLIEK